MTNPPTFESKQSVAARIAALRSIDDIDEMLLEGSSCGDVAKCIQKGLEELLDVSHDTLERTLVERRLQLQERAKQQEEDGGREAAIVPVTGRISGKLARNQYDRIRKGIERLLELECVYLAARDRVDALILKEQELGYPFEMTGREILVLVKLLEQHGKEEDRVRAIMDQGFSHEKLDLKGYSEETARVLAKPDSRRRVVSIVERLKRVHGGRDIPELSEPEPAAAEMSSG